MDYGTAYSSSNFQWRFPLSFQAVFAVCPVLQVVGLPETQRWLVAHDRYEEARAVTAALEDHPLNDEVVNATILDIRSGLEEEHKEGLFRFKELFQWGEVQNFRRLPIIISMGMRQQFSGSHMINVSTYHA